MPGVNDINLVPPEIVGDQRNRRRIRKWSILIACQIVCFCFLGIVFYSYLRRVEGRAATRRIHNREMKQAGARLVATYQGIEDVQKKRDALLNLTRKQCFTPILINLARDMDTKTRLVHLQVHRGKSTASSETADYYELTLQGISQSYQSLSNFLLHLQQDKSFQEIRLIRSDMDKKENSFISFEISLIYRGTGQD
ncbi:MAG: PilN domain-containing protein [bacterium]